MFHFNDTPQARRGANHSGEPIVTSYYRKPASFAEQDRAKQIEDTRFQPLYLTGERYSAGQPLDDLARKFDETDLYLPDDTVHQWSQSQLMDYTRDSVPAPGDEPKNARPAAQRALNLRIHGKESGEAEPYNGETFYGDLSREQNLDISGNPMILRGVAEGKQRARYQVFKSEGEQSVPEKTWGPGNIYDARHAADLRVRQVRQFHDSNVAVLGKGYKADSAYLMAARRKELLVSAEGDNLDGQEEWREAQPDQNEATPGKSGKIARADRGRKHEQVDWQGLLGKEDQVVQGKNAKAPGVGRDANLFISSDSTWGNAMISKTKPAIQTRAMLDWIGARNHSVAGENFGDSQTMLPRGELERQRLLARADVLATRLGVVGSASLASEQGSTMRPQPVLQPGEGAAAGMAGRGIDHSTLRLAEDQVAQLIKTIIPPADLTKVRAGVVGSANFRDDKATFVPNKTAQVSRDPHSIKAEQEQSQVAWLVATESTPRQSAARFDIRSAQDGAAIARLDDWGEAFDGAGSDSNVAKLRRGGAMLASGTPIGRQSDLERQHETSAPIEGAIQLGFAAPDQAKNKTSGTRMARATTISSRESFNE